MTVFERGFFSIVAVFIITLAVAYDCQATEGYVKGPGIGGTWFVGSPSGKDRVVVISGDYWITKDGEVFNASLSPLSEYDSFPDRYRYPGDGIHRIIGKDVLGNTVTNFPAHIINDYGKDNFIRNVLRSSRPFYREFRTVIRLPARVRRLEFWRGDQLVVARDASPHIPKVKILSPKKGEVWRRGEWRTLRWEIDDPDSGRNEITSYLEYRERPGVSWASSARIDSLGNSRSVRVKTDWYKPGKRAQFLLAVNDGWHTSYALSPYFVVKPYQFSADDIHISIESLGRPKVERLSYHEPRGYRLNAFALDPNNNREASIGSERTRTYRWYRTSKASLRRGKLIGRGSELTVRRLLNGPGTVKITVVVKTRAGTASKSTSFYLGR